MRFSCKTSAKFYHKCKLQIARAYSHSYMREKTCFFLNFALQISVSYDKFYLLFVGKGPTTEGRNNRMGGGGEGVGRLPLFTFHFANKKLIRLINNNNTTS